ncbi:MAG: PPC domain-containing protein [Gemmataceae bacterium]|nr:PPC domain-containing protein [Gemmataceae bacterium]
MRWHPSFSFSITSRAAGLVALLTGTLLTSFLVAQPPPGAPMALPRLLYATPPGAKAGSTMELMVTGFDLEEPATLLFSHSAIKAEYVGTGEPPPDPKKKPNPRQPGTPMTQKYKVTLPPDTPLGLHDVRLVNAYGISNPRAFMVGDLNEVTEKEPNNDVEQAQRVELNSTINGTITTPTDVDYYVFAGKKDQRVVVSCLTSSIESKMHGVIEMYDSAGKKLGSNRDYNQYDSALDYKLPADGDYFVRAFQFTHLQGGADHYYRLSISTAPWIDAVFPPVVEPGKPATLTVYGRNLPGGQPDPTATLGGSVLEKATVTVNVPNDPNVVQRLAYSGSIAPNASGLDGFEYRLKNGSGSSNPYLLVFAGAPVVVDNGQNLTRETAQALTTPCEVGGKLDKTHSHAWYTFSAKKGDVYSIELTADRLGSPIDLALGIYNAETKGLVAELDDVLPTDAEYLSANQFYTRTSDPARYQLKVPADGKYQVIVRSQEGTQRAGPRQLYRLRITPEQPDFRLVLMPTSISNPDSCVLRQGGNQDYTVFIWRRDGFNGDIALGVDGLPPGVTCKPQVAGPTVKQTALVLTASADAAPWSGEIKAKGTAKINGKDVVREARAATITWAGNPQQPQAAQFSRLDRSLVLAIRDKAPFNVVLGAETASAPQGDKVTVPIKIERLWPDAKAPVQVQAVGLPTGMTFNNNNAPMAVANDNGSLVLTVGPNVPPGNYSIVFRGTSQVPYSKDPMAKMKPNVAVTQPSLPVTVSVVPKTLATLTVTPPNATAKVGTEVKVMVKVARLLDFPGEFKVELVQPPTAKGIAAPEVTIPAGKDEIELVLKVDADAPPGNRADLLVRATAMYGATAVKHEQKFAVNVTK